LNINSSCLYDGVRVRIYERWEAKKVVLRSEIWLVR